MILQSRRNFITGLTSLLAAPAIIRISSIMPIKVINLNNVDVLYEYSHVKLEWVPFKSEWLIIKSWSEMMYK